MSAVNGIGWELQWLSPTGWENAFRNLDGSPLIFPNKEDAEEELDLYRTTTFCTDEYRVYESLSDHQPQTKENSNDYRQDD